MGKASDNVFPKVILGPLGAPSAPSDASWKLYAMANGVYAKSSNTTIGPLGTGGGGTSVATDTIWDAAGDLAVGSGADTAARLAIGSTNGMVVQRVSGAVAWAIPAGYEYDYVQITSNVSITATSEATANTCITGSAVTYDGSTTVYVEVFCPALAPDPTATRSLTVWLYDGSSSIGAFANVYSQHNNSNTYPLHGFRKLTPSAASHTYSIRCSVSAGTGTFSANTGGTGVYIPAFLRITKA